MSSLRARLVASTFLGTSLTFAVCGVALYAVLRVHVREELDRSLVDVARSSAAATIAAEGWGDLDAPEPEPRFVLDGVAFAPWVGDQDPRDGVPVAPQQLWDRLNSIRDDTLGVRTYGVGAGLDQAAEMIHLLGLRSAIGAWVGPDMEANHAELDRLIELAHEGHVDVAVVGNEVLRRGDLPLSNLVDLLRRAREELPANVPLATAAIYQVWVDEPALVDAVDQVFVNLHPFWEGVSVEEAVAVIACRSSELTELANGKRVVLSETGWPSAGPDLGRAQATAEAAAAYMHEFVAWARLNEVSFFYFSTFDESWKSEDEGGNGPHWGYRFNDGLPKPGVREVFDAPLQPLGPPTIEITHLPAVGSTEPLVGRVANIGAVNHRVALYLRTATGWRTKPGFDKPLTPIDCNGSFLASLSGDGDATGDRVLAALLPVDFVPPILDGVPDIPKSLRERAIALCEVDR